MKTFHNPWYDSRNQLSPKEFEVSDKPIESFDVLDCYDVLNDHQGPSVLVVVNHKRVRECTENKGKGAYDYVAGQCVTVEGAKRMFLGDDYDA